MAANRRLATLGELEDVAPAAGDPDPRGWNVIAADGRRIGRVAELIVEPSSMKVRYLDCELYGEEPQAERPGGHVLLPIGFARLDEHGASVIVDVLTSSEIAELPRYTGLPLGGDQEERLREAFVGRQPPEEGSMGGRPVDERSSAPRDRRG